MRAGRRSEGLVGFVRDAPALVFEQLLMPLGHLAQLRARLAQLVLQGRAVLGHLRLRLLIVILGGLQVGRELRLDLGHTRAQPLRLCTHLLRVRARVRARVGARVGFRARVSTHRREQHRAQRGLEPAHVRQQLGVVRLELAVGGQRRLRSRGRRGRPCRPTGPRARGGGGGGGGGGDSDGCGCGVGGVGWSDSAGFF